MYQRRSAHGGVVTLILSFCLIVLLWGDVYTFLAGQRTTQFAVDPSIGHDLQINLDMTINMPCQYLQVNLRDAAGDIKIIDESDIARDGTFFAVSKEHQVDNMAHDLDIGDTVYEGRKRKVIRDAQRSGKYNPRGHSGFPKTYPRVTNGPACRLYGSMMVKRVTGNLHITAAGHGYWSPVSTPDNKMNLTHVIHELSFGPFFPRIVEPLDASVEIAEEKLTSYQYFLSIVPTRFIATSGRYIDTNQYSVTDYVRKLTAEDRLLPGIFIKYDVEPVALTIRARSISWLKFLVRLAGVIGGLWVCTGMAVRVFYRARLLVQRLVASRGIEASGSEPLWSDNRGAPSYDAGYSGSWNAGYGNTPMARAGYTGVL